MTRFLMAFLVVMLLSAVAFAGGRDVGHPYVGGIISGQQLEDTDIASSSLDVSFDVGYGASAYAGYHWPVGFRLELEGSYFKSDIDKVKSGAASANPDGSVDMKALMVNALWEFKNETNWISYLGLGGGYGWSKGKAAGASASDSIPLAQPILGVGYKITDQILMDVSYRYMMGLEKLDYDGVKGDFRAHRLGLGLRYEF